MDLTEHVARALHENGPMTTTSFEAVMLEDDSWDTRPYYESDVRAALFHLYLAGQLQFWRHDGPWKESPTGPTREMGDVHYALSRNHAVGVDMWFLWHGEGQ